MTIQLQPEQIYNSTPKNVDRFGTVATIIMYVTTVKYPFFHAMIPNWVCLSKPTNG